MSLPVPSFFVARRVFGRLLAAATLSAAAALGPVACGEDDPTGGTPITGTYALQTVNGQSLPFTITSSTQFFAMEEGDEIVSGVLTLDTDNTFFFEIAGETPEATVVRIEAEGTWSRAGNTITLTGTGDSFEVELDGARVLIAADVLGLPLVFRK
ncbi:MAG: hypothetical protein M3125_07660 [Gemmatimonadota bacterium]|nr:hypothetical protein [Gemmatimonadota bacterium]